MNLTKLSNELEHHFLIKSTPVEEEDVTLIASLMLEGNYQQILYQYKIEVLLEILEYLETNDHFEQCSLVVKTIKDTNKLEKTKYPTTYR